MSFVGKSLAISMVIIFFSGNSNVVLLLRLITLFLWEWKKCDGLLCGIEDVSSDGSASNVGRILDGCNWTILSTGFRSYILFISFR